MSRRIRDDVALRMTAAKFKALRLEAGKLQKEVERDTGLNIGYIEAAQYDLSIQSIEHLSCYYGLTLAEFFEGLGL